MCGRFTLTTEPEQLQDEFPWLSIPVEMRPRYNIAPTQPVVAVPNDGKHEINFFYWGLIPSWTKDPKIGERMINARAETIAEKPAFRNAFRHQRCLVFANGFYEWRQESNTKVKIPYYIQLKTKKPFAFAGLWEVWNSPEGLAILSCTIITTSPNQLLSEIHNRMPVILPSQSHADWLAPGDSLPSRLQPLLTSYPAEEMVAFPVSRLVNNVQNDSVDCILPIH